MKKNQLKFQFILGILFGCGLWSSDAAWANALDPDAIRGRSIAKPVSVLQNRYFTKVMRPEIGLAAGRFLNEAYTDTTTVGFRGSLFITEWAGVEAQFVRASISDSDDRKALKKLVYRELDSNATVSPNVEDNPVKNYVDLSGILAPFYGKLNFFDQIIIYSDLYLSAGITNLETQQGAITALSFGAGQRFYWKKNLSIRIDFKNRNYSETRKGETYNKNQQSVDVGLSYFFL